MGSARFTIEASPSTDAGYDAADGATLGLTLEDIDSDIFKAEFSIVVVDYDSIGHEPAFDQAILGSGVALDYVVQLSLETLGSTYGSAYWIRCVVNNGKDAAGEIKDEYTFDRIVVVRNADGVRPVLPGETTQYYPVYGWTKEISRGAGGTGVEAPTPSTLMQRTATGAARVAALAVEGATDAARWIAGLLADGVTLARLTYYATSHFLRGNAGAEGGLLITPGADGSAVTLAGKNADGVTTKPVDIVATALTLNGAPIGGGSPAVHPFTSGTPTLVSSGSGDINRLSGTVTAATLPPAVLGESCIVELVGLGDIVVSRDGTDTINGATSYTVPGATDPVRTVVAFICDAAGEWTVGAARGLPTFDCGVSEAIAITHSTQAVGMAGKTDTWTGQQGASGFNGGGFKYTVGAAGDATHTPGTFEIDVGAENGSSTAGSFKISAAGVQRFLLQVFASVVYLTTSGISWAVTGLFAITTTTTITLAAGTYLYNRANYFYHQIGARLFFEVSPPPTVAAITTATTTTVQTLGLQNGSSNYVEFVCVVSDNTAHKSQTFHVTATVRVNGGAATIVSQVDSSPADTDAVGCTFALDTSTTNVRGRLTTPSTNNVTVACTARNHYQALT